MKEIGEKLREERLSIGISIEEAAEDLKMRPIQIENIEEGNMSAFQDIFYLKYFIRDYSKYLGLKYEDIVDEFNEFLFDYTSKISLDDIKEAQKKSNEKEKTKKITSPYTLERRNRIDVTPIVVYILIIILVVVGVYMYLKSEQDDFNNNSIVINEINRRVL
ncbi:MAG: helix-turn-helix domain-containing protein [Bacilli bacterium]